LALDEKKSWGKVLVGVKKVGKMFGCGIKSRGKVLVGCKKVAGKYGRGKF